MAHQVVWTKRVVDLFVEYGKLNEFQRQVLETRVAGMTIRQQAFYLNVSESVVSRCVAKLKKVYDIVQSQHPDELRPRKSCAQQLYQDTN